MKLILCAQVAQKLKAENPGQHKKDKCQCCGKIRWCTRWEVKP